MVVLSGTELIEERRVRVDRHRVLLGVELQHAQKAGAEGELVGSEVVPRSVAVHVDLSGVVARSVDALRRRVEPGGSATRRGEHALGRNQVPLVVGEHLHHPGRPVSATDRLDVRAHTVEVAAEYQEDVLVAADYLVKQSAPVGAPWGVASVGLARCAEVAVRDEDSVAVTEPFKNRVSPIDLLVAP